jgi:hypothetical protein
MAMARLTWRSLQALTQRPHMMHLELSRTIMELLSS